jgi:hypothetical protein
MARKLTSTEQRQFAKAVVLSEYYPLPTQADDSTLQFMQSSEETSSNEGDAPTWRTPSAREPQ